MENKIKPIVKSPHRTKKPREGYGFSIEEVKESGHSVEDLKKHGIRVDIRRRSAYEWNIEKLKELELPEEEEKREPFVPRAKKPKKRRKPKVKREPVDLTELDGLGSATDEKLKLVGVNSVQGILREDPEELAAIVKGASAESIKKWQEEGKELVKK
ncbi:MAG: ribosomal protein L13e [Promethearchaeia archaeon]